jgi:hypothetical protein
MNAKEPTPQQRMAALHAWYGAAMGCALPLNAAWERAWWDWMAAGYNGRQLRCVMNYIRREIGNRRRNPGALKLSNLLNVERFAEDLLMAGSDTDPERPLPGVPREEGGGQGQSSKFKDQKAEAPRRVAPPGGQQSEAGARAFEEFRKMKGRLP